MEFKRERVIELHLAGLTQAEITRKLSDLKVNKMFVSRTVTRYKQNGSIVGKPVDIRKIKPMDTVSAKRIRLSLKNAPTTTRSPQTAEDCKTHDYGTDDGDSSFDDSNMLMPLRYSSRSQSGGGNPSNNTTKIQPQMAARENATNEVTKNGQFECGIVNDDVIPAVSIEFAHDSDLLKECKVETELDPLYVTNAARLATAQSPRKVVESAPGDRERSELLREQNALLRKSFDRAEAHRREMLAYCRGIEKHNRCIEAHNRKMEARLGSHNRAIEEHNRIMRDLKRQKLEFMMGKRETTQEQ